MGWLQGSLPGVPRSAQAPAVSELQRSVCRLDPIETPVIRYWMITKSSG